MDPRRAEPWRRRLARWLAKAWPHLLAGVAVSLFMAWGLPMLLAVRGVGPSGAPMSLWHRGPSSELWSDHAPSLSVRRSAFSDWYIAEPVTTALDPRTYWPDADLEDSSGHARSAPDPVVVAPPVEQSSSWTRIDTGLAGWPFRCFASEAWYPATPGDRAVELPEFRWNAHVGLIAGQHILVPLRPLAGALALDIVFWATVSWCVTAGPREFRRRRRLKYGHCPACGHATDAREVRRPEHCSECGARWTPDPLGFAHAPEMHFQNAYVWIIFVSSLDIMLTWKILDRGGIEVNPLAALVIDAWGMHGAIAFKFALMMWVIVVCEVLARLRRGAGKFLAVTAVAVSASPVAWSLVLLVLHEFVPAALE
jgi:hypothetical protein